MECVLLTTEYDAAIVRLIKSKLKANHLDIPGTVFFNPRLDHLSEYYAHPGRTYFVLLDHGQVIGCIGLAEFSGFDDCVANCRSSISRIAQRDRGCDTG